MTETFKELFLSKPEDLYPVVDGTVFVPIPENRVDAYELYRRMPLVHHAVNWHSQSIKGVGTEDAVDKVLSRGPTVLEIPIEQLGLDQ